MNFPPHNNNILNIIPNTSRKRSNNLDIDAWFSAVLQHNICNKKFRFFPGCSLPDRQPVESLFSLHTATHVQQNKINTTIRIGNHDKCTMWHTHKTTSLASVWRHRLWLEATLVHRPSLFYPAALSSLSTATSSPRHPDLCWPRPDSVPAVSSQLWSPGRNLPRLSTNQLFPTQILPIVQVHSSSFFFH